MNPALQKIIEIPFPGGTMEGNLVIPQGSSSLVIFSHGSGSSRFSVRNNFVAEILNQGGISTFLFDLLTKKEDAVYENRFNIELLTDRLICATQYLAKMEELKNFRIGYFGASTGAASALKAAARIPGLVSAVVSRGGRPDLAIHTITEVLAPTLLIVGELDHDMLNLNHKAYKYMMCDRRFEIVKGATHLFEEPGALDKVALLARDWFTDHLVKTKKRNPVEY